MCRHGSRNGSAPQGGISLTHRLDFGLGALPSLTSSLVNSTGHLPCYENASAGHGKDEIIRRTWCKLFISDCSRLAAAVRRAKKLRGLSRLYLALVPSAFGERKVGLSDLLEIKEGNLKR